jgi:transposase InsO family protein
MAWKEASIVSERTEFVGLARQLQSGAITGISMGQLCERFNISRKTGYKWLGRAQSGSPTALEDLSRRPQRMPRMSSPQLEAAVLAVRDQHPAWGGRKIRAVLIRQRVCSVPAASTITRMLERTGRLNPDESTRHKAWQRFEHERPNDLWQMDFKGDVETARGRCYPLTALDDHSRYSLVLEACADQRTGTVKTAMTSAFRKYGLPHRILTDNGPPWGCDSERPWTVFAAWLIRLGVTICHGRPYHPQTQGKEERFHRTLQAEVLRETMQDRSECQRRFDLWREVYNHERPHQALAMDVPASRYRPSPRAFPEKLPGIEYAPDLKARKVGETGRIRVAGKRFRIGRAFAGEPVGLRPTTVDGIIEVYFCHQRVYTIDLRDGDSSD